MGNRFRWSLWSACLVAIGFAVSPAAAEWPERPIHLIVAYGAGGGTDTLSRLVAEPLAKLLGQPVVVENKPGAGGTIGADAAAKAAPDGYTVYMMANGHAVAAAIYKSLSYDPVDGFRPISLVATMPLVLVARPDFKANTLAELVALAKEKPGALNYASVGVGSSQHFAGALLQQMAGIDMVHIPYQKTPEAIAALLSGEVQLLVEVGAAVLGQVQSGELKALLITSADGYPLMPKVATVAASGYPDYNVATWYGLAYPAGTPTAIVDKTAAALDKVLKSEDLRAKATTAGYVVTSSTPDAFAALLKSEVERWSAVRAKAGIEQR